MENITVKNIKLRNWPQFISIAFMGMLTLSLMACSNTKINSLDVYKGQSAHELFTKGEDALKKGNYDSAIKYYDALIAFHPFSPDAPQALLDSSYSAYKSHDRALALAKANQFIRLYPTHAHVDYAYYLKGVANFTTDRGILSHVFNMDVSQRDLSDQKEAYADFNLLIDRFPNSPYTPDARRRMIYLRNLLAQHEIHVAEYYMRRQAYVAAANRASYVINHFQQSPFVEDALIILAKAYDQLELPDLAAQTRAVLALNYPKDAA